MKTFVVRVWPGSDGDGGTDASLGDTPADLRGIVRQVTDGSEVAFTGSDELLQLLRAPAARVGVSGRPRGATTGRRRPIGEAIPKARDDGS
jgi:hypothetical protein